MDLGIKGKTALVAGASAGLGLATARALFDEGAQVAICSRDKKRINQAAESITIDRDRIFPLTCDLTVESEIDLLVKEVETTYGGIDILVTNCGGPPLGKHDEIGEKHWELAYNLTFMSTIRLVQKAIPSMKSQRFGRIIMITSTSAKQPIDNLLLSNSYRAGLLGYAKTLSRELGACGITVNTVMPGFHDTDRLGSMADELSAAAGKTRDDIYAGWIDTVPVGRLGKPEEFGQLVTYLASEQAGYITGTATAIDGGRTTGIL